MSNKSGRKIRDPQKRIIDDLQRLNGTRIKTSILLTGRERSILDKISRDSGTNRSLIVEEAVQLGLRQTCKLRFEGRRIHRINVWIPEESLRAVRETAARHSVSQQSVFRLFLSNYRKHTSKAARSTQSTSPLRTGGPLQ